MARGRSEQPVSVWRSEIFRELNRPLPDLVGAKTAQALAELGLQTIADLLTHVPRRYLSGTETTRIADLEPGESMAVVARIHSMSRRGQEPRARLEVVLTDGEGYLPVVFFGRGRLIESWQKQLSRGIKGIFVGKVGVFNGNLQLTHPDFVMLDAAGTIVGRASHERAVMAEQVSRSGLVGIYPATAKLPTWRIAECAGLALDAVAGLADPLPEALRTELGLPGLVEAFTELHRPSQQASIEAARERLKFDEALRLQVTMSRRRARSAQLRARPLTVEPGGLLAAFDARLPFTLTAGQRQVGAEILADLGREQPMQRLLQGEVGSGKTVLAVRAMLAAVDAGQQAVLLAPTEVLAGQHASTIATLLGDLGHGAMLGQGTELALLTGSLSASARRQALDAIAQGTAGIVIGTHALLQQGVHFADLGLVVIDEQHRFGVEQRAVLQEKASTHPHVLVMTATPIPRSVAMTVFGDLDISTLRELPGDRPGVQTTVVDARAHPHWLERAWQRIREEVATGRQAFVVCPRINPSEADPESADEGRPPSATVTELIQTLQAGPLAGLRVASLHGRMSSEEKDTTMAAFAAGRLDVLVSTTVIEVGVDVPNASVMVIMDADRFGVSQLHQLRGRIGRGAHPGVCLLVTSVEPGSPAAERLAAVASTTDGFELAELDLVQRREGDVLGASQAGSRSTLRLLRVIDDAELIQQAREVAERLVAADPAGDDPVLADMVTQTEQLTAGDWLDRT